MNLPVTTDVCEVEFPPASYGDTLTQVQATVQDVIERVFRDDDGILRSGVWGKTMRPRTVDDVKDRPHAIGCYSENAAIPRELKPIWLNYENAEQASGKYLTGLAEKFKVTGGKETAELARRTFAAFDTLLRNVAEKNPWGEGWMPKPYGGIHNVAELFECSEDQYADVTLGLHAFHDTFATPAQQERIKDIVASFVHWWHDRDYAGAYFGRGIWWKRLGYPHVVGGFLYMTALADFWRPHDDFKAGFATWFELMDGFYPAPEHRGVNGAGLALDSLEHLIDLKPQHAAMWRKIAKDMADQIVDCVKAGNAMPHLKGKTQAVTYSAHYLSVAHRMMPDGGYDRWAIHCLESATDRADFYHVVRGQPIADLEHTLAGDDYRDTFWCEGHVCHFNGYWRLKSAGAAVD